MQPVADPDRRAGAQERTASSGGAKELLGNGGPEQLHYRLGELITTWFSLRELHPATRAALQTITGRA